MAAAGATAAGAPAGADGRCDWRAGVAVMPDGGMAGEGARVLASSGTSKGDLSGASRQQPAGSSLALLAAWSVAKFASLGRWVH
ncbi:hypothetical protein F5B21DRAFT_506460 [Xylaria acuta]|nr:hypothetical protein F5B21DRAFT_506460 [Xylaria acuta]